MPDAPLKPIHLRGTREQHDRCALKRTSLTNAALPEEAGSIARQREHAQTGPIRLVAPRRAIETDIRLKGVPRQTRVIFQAHQERGDAGSSHAPGRR